MMKLLTQVVLALLVMGLSSSCTTDLSEEDMALAMSPKIRAYFNFTGTRNANGHDPEVDDMTIQMIDRANDSIDFAVMGFTRTEVIDALVRAYYRGVRLRFVGDARHHEGHTSGYDALDRLDIPMIVGNQFHIMHDKFFVIDHRFVVTGTGNITPTGYEKNTNNYVFIDSPLVSSDFTDEFNQMFDGRFGNAKHVIDNGNHYEIGDTILDVYFSPQEDAMGRILEEIDEAQESVYFMIFAFTKDQVGSALIRKHLEFSRYNMCCDPARRSEVADDPDLIAECEGLVVCETPYRRKEVRGVIDKSQLHSNGPYHEVYRLLLSGVPMRLDGNDHSYLPGDYQAGGGRLHSKTMVIDPGTDTAKVLTGSFNWSSSATIANDETFLVLDGERVAAQTKEFWDDTWGNGKAFGVDYAGQGGSIHVGDVVFNEIHWDGYNGTRDLSDFGGDDVYNDEFIELLNTTDHAIDLSMWTIGTQFDFVVGLYPGTIIGPHERFLLVDHNIEPFTDTEPQDSPHAFKNADFVMNTANDQRFLRLNLRNASLFLRLVDPRGTEIDHAGDGGPPFFGGRRYVSESELDPIPSADADACSDIVDSNGNQRMVNYSMERRHFTDGDPIRNGALRDSWARASSTGANINPCFEYNIVATPGEKNAVNTGTHLYDDVPEDFRQP